MMTAVFATLPAPFFALEMPLYCHASCMVRDDLLWRQLLSSLEFQEQLKTISRADLSFLLSSLDEIEKTLGGY